MGSEHWFRRGDGAEFAVAPDSDAEANLIRMGALRISGPGADLDSSDGPADPLDGTKRELLAYAEAEGLIVDVTMANNRDEILEAVKAALATRAAEG